MFNFLSKKFSNIFVNLTNKGRLTDENIKDAMQQVKTALIQADVPLQVINNFLFQIKEEIIGKKIQTKVNPGHYFVKIVHEKLRNFLGSKTTIEKISFQIPSIIMVMGLQGSGKTTTVAKIAHWVKKEAQKRNKKRRILLASVDFYRPAAIEQLEILAKQIGVSFYASPQNTPLDAAKDIYNYYKKNKYELLFLDTAGRLHIDNQMMEELKSIKNLINPKYSFLVLDAMTGQESLQVAKKFNNIINFNYAILTKMDSDTRGGAAFAFRYVLSKPISFTGIGEKIEDLEAFIPDRIATRILGMGDVLTLIEKANENINTKSQEDLAKRMIKGNFSLNDFSKQLNMVEKIGSLSKIARYLPGINQISNEQLNQSQLEMKQFRAVMSSMTTKERLFPQILNSSRKQRIAKGAGSTVQIINQLLQKFEQSRQFVKMFKKTGKLAKYFK